MHIHLIVLFLLALLLYLRQQPQFINPHCKILNFLLLIIDNSFIVIELADNLFMFVSVDKLLGVVMDTDIVG